MAIDIKTMRSVKANGAKVLAYGQSGAGKTRAIVTIPNVFVISAEAGLLSLANACEETEIDIPYVDIKSMRDLQAAFAWATSSAESEQFECIAIDSLSEIAEVVLAAEKRTAKDPRQAYGETQEQMTSIIRGFRDIVGKHVYFTAKMEKSTDEMGKVSYAPSMPGNKLGQGLPYFFDEVLAFRVEKDEAGDPVHAVMCRSDGLWMAKDRSGRLDPWEPMDVGHIIGKLV